jgi:hypothetical protein
MTIFRSTSADFRFPLPRLLALPTEAWRGAEIRRCSAENSYVNLPGPEEFKVGPSDDSLVAFVKSVLECLHGPTTFGMMTLSRAAYSIMPKLLHCT